MRRMRLFQNMHTYIVVGIITLVVSGYTLFTLNDFGISWDEPIYFSKIDQYFKWFTKPSLSKIDELFHPSAEIDIHPPFRKYIAGLTHVIFTEKLTFISNTNGYRISALFFIIPCIFVMGVFSIRQFGYLIGILTILMFSFSPQIFYLSNVLTLDYAIAALWFLTTMSYSKWILSVKGIFITSILLGLTLLTKFHGFILYLWLCIYFIFTNRKSIIQQRNTGKVIVFVCLPLIIFFIGWPWLWINPVGNFIKFLTLQSSHGDISVWFLGKLYTRAPWYYTLVQFFTTTPVMPLLLFLYGVVRIIRKGNQEWKFILYNALLPILFFSLPFVFRYDGIRLFLPAYPFVFLIAGFGLNELTKYIHKTLVKHIFLITLLMIWCASAIWYFKYNHPYEASYYNSLVGGVDGANRLGLEVEYWGNAWISVLPWMNQNKIHPMCVFPTTAPFYYYQAMGMIEPGVVFTARDKACEYFVILMRKGLFSRDPYVEEVVNNITPIYSVKYSHTPLVNVYKIH